MKKLNWQQAMEFCQNLEFAGHTDWRLPSRKELNSLIDDTQVTHSLPISHPFLNVQPSAYWSSSTHAYYTYDACYVGLGYGYVFNFDKHDFNYVWPVRGGQFDHSGFLILSELLDGQERFTDNLDGTVKDNRTGLIWLKNLNSI